MSDAPPPPPPSSVPPPPVPAPPPPPPPNLMAPPGYAGYTPSPMTSAVPLRRIGGVAKAAMVLAALSALMSIGELAARNASIDEAEAFQAGEVSDTEFVESVAGYALLGFVIAMVTVATAVVTIIWLYRIAANHRALHRGTTWGPGWAIGGWFLPPLLYIIPTLVLTESWKAADPDVPIGGDWRRGRTSPLVIVWFLVYSLVPIALFAAQVGSTFDSLGGSEDQLADQITGDQTLSIVGAAASVAAAVVFVMLVRALTARHRRLTGEAGR